MTDLTRRRGDSYADEIIVQASDGTALDVTGYSFLLTVDPSPEPTTSDNNLFQVAGVILDAAAGLVEFAPTTVQTDQTAGRYYYDIQMTDDSGRVRTIATGSYSITMDITK